MNISDAPWIREAERTGHCRTGYWNQPPEVEDHIVCDRCKEWIVYGEDYYPIGDQNLCEECFDIVSRKWRRTYGD